MSHHRRANGGCGQTLAAVQHLYSQSTGMGFFSQLEAGGGGVHQNLAFSREKNFTVTRVGNTLNVLLVVALKTPLDDTISITNHYVLIVL